MIRLDIRTVKAAVVIAVPNDFNKTENMTGPMPKTVPATPAVQADVSTGIWSGAPMANVICDLPGIGTGSLCRTRHRGVDTTSGNDRLRSLF